MTGPDAPSPRWMRPRAQALLLFAFAALLYAGTVSFRHAQDDALVITGNRFTQRGFVGIRDILFHDSFAGYRSEQERFLPGGRYRPLAQVWFAVEHELFGNRPAVGHLTNALLYGALAALLFRVLGQLFGQGGGGSLLSLPFAAAALYAAHPLHTEVVANVKGRDEILSLLLGLLTIRCALAYTGRRRRRDLAFIAATFLLALLAKENAVAFLAVVPLSLFVRGDARGRDHLAVLAALGGGLGVYLLAFRLPALGYLVSAPVPVRELLNDPFLDATAAQRHATVLLTWLSYLRLLAWPHPLTHDYYPKQVPIVGWDDPRPWLALALYGALAAFSLSRIRRRGAAAYGILFSLLTFSVQSNLVFDVGTFMNERFLFAPSVGYCLALATVFTAGRTGGGRWVAGRAAAALFAAALAGYAAKTLARLPAWRDDFTLVTTDVETSPNSARITHLAGELWLGKALVERDPAARETQLDKAISHLERAVALNPRRDAGWLLLGDARRHRGDREGSRAAYDRCLRENPGNLKAQAGLLQLGQGCVEDGRREAAAEAYRTLLRHNPGSRNGTAGLARCLEELSREALVRGQEEPARRYLAELKALTAR